MWVKEVEKREQTKPKVKRNKRNNTDQSRNKQNRAEEQRLVTSLVGSWNRSAKMEHFQLH